MISGTKPKAALSLAFAALCLALFTAQATAVPVLGLEMERTVTPLHRGDERLVYELTVKNEAGANPSLGDELSCTGTPEDGNLWFADPAADFSYAWLRDATPIVGETAKTHTVTAEDEGATLQCVLTGTNDADGPGGSYAPISGSFASAPIAVAPAAGTVLTGSAQPGFDGSQLSTPQGTATVTSGSNLLTEVITAKGTGTVTAGSKIIEDLVTNSGIFFAGKSGGSLQQEISGAGIPPGTIVMKRVSADKIEISNPANETPPAPVSLEAGSLPFYPDQEITGKGILPGTTIVVSQSGDPEQTLRLSAPATESETGVAVTGIAKETCVPPSGWSGDGAISWSFRWLRNGQPIPGADTDTYVVQKADTEPPSQLQCEATATDAAGNKAIAISGGNPTVPEPENPYISPRPRGGDPVVDFANQTTGPVTLEFEPQGGVETYVFGARSKGAWDCTKQAPTAVENSLITCTREASLSPGDSYPPVEMIVAVSKNAPAEVASKARVAGGGASNEPAAEDQFTLGPPLPWDFEAFEAKATDELGADYVTAAGHPYAASAKFSFTTHERVEESEGFGFTRAPNGYARVIRTDIPPGFIGNPQAPPENCPSIADVIHSPGQTTCPAGSVVGGLTIETGLQTFEGVPIYSIEPEDGAPAEFAFGIAENNLSFGLVPELRAENGYAIRLLTAPIGKWPELFGAEATLCGFGGKLGVKVTGESKFDGCKKAADPDANPIPFLTNPTRCEGGPPITRISADTWEEPGVFIEAEDPAEPVEGCENVPFEPEIEAKPTTNRSDSPTGLDFDLHVPQNEAPEGLASAHLRKAVVTLPEGLVVNPSGANGLGACSEAQLGMEGGVPDDEPVRCPDSSKIGAVSVTTPLLDHALPGSLYVAMPHKNPFGSLIALYLTVESPKDGITIKLAGKTEADPVTGRLTTSFDQNPQAPVEDVALKLRGGASAPLRTPVTCGKYTVVSSLTPWSAPQSGPPASAKDTWQINRGPGGGACASSLPNTPSFEAGSASPIAAIHSPFVVKLRREDGTQRFSQVTVSPPPGVLAKLAGTSPCSDSALAAAQARSGTEEQASPSCPPASELGSVIAAAGAGPAPYQATGKAYLAGPYKGAPLSIAIITPATAGPFDLGVVVVRAAAYIDPATARVTVKSDPLPRILEGIPLDIRSATVSIDRPDFILNPTSCDPMAVGGELLSDLGQSATLESRFQLGECGRLPFKPRLSLRLEGKTKRGDYQGVSAVLRPRAGDANIAGAVVRFPKSAFVAQEHIRTICTRVQWAADACPKGSIYGTAIAKTPLLDYPLSGKVYLRSSDNELPDAVADLRGPAHQPIRVEVAIANDSVDGALRNTVASAPDAPVSWFRLQLFGGNKGLIVNSRNLCASKQRAGVSLDAHNGKERSFKPLVRNGCSKGRKGQRR